MLVVEDLWKSYGTHPALRGVDVEVHPAEILGLLGPNGAGKTTFVSIIAGLLRPDGGKVLIDGVDALAEGRRARRSLGIAPQEIAVYPNATVRENLAFFGRLTGVASKLLGQRVDELLHALQLEDIADQLTWRVSGGQQRRVHTAVALIHSPSIILLDEPTAGVDVTTRSDLLDLIKKLAENGATVCYSTHYLHEVETLGATVALLESGEVIARGPVEQLISEYGSPSIELSFIGDAPRIARKWKAKREGGTLRVPARNPGTALPEVLTALGDEVHRVDSVEVLKPSLEAAYLALTGRRYHANSDNGGGPNA